MEKIPFSREEMKVVGSHIGFSSVLVGDFFTCESSSVSVFLTLSFFISLLSISSIKVISSYFFNIVLL